MKKNFSFLLGLFFSASVFAGLIDDLNSCAPHIAENTMAGILIVESQTSPFAIGIDRPYGYRLDPPQSKADAIAKASDLLHHGYSIGMGACQISSGNFTKFHMSLEQVFDRCGCLSVAEPILRQCYAVGVKMYGPGQNALRSAFLCYNTGKNILSGPNAYVTKARLASICYDAVKNSSHADEREILRGAIGCYFSLLKKK